MDAQRYFEGKRAEALRSELEAESKRFDSDMRIARWRGEVWDVVLLKCSEGSTIDDGDIADIERYLADPYHFTCESCRKDAADFFLESVTKPMQRAAE